MFDFRVKRYSEEDIEYVLKYQLGVATSHPETDGTFIPTAFIEPVYITITPLIETAIGFNVNNNTYNMVGDTLALFKVHTAIFNVNDLQSIGNGAKYTGQIYKYNNKPYICINNYTGSGFIKENYQEIPYQRFIKILHKTASNIFHFRYKIEGYK